MCIMWRVFISFPPHFFPCDGSYTRAGEVCVAMTAKSRDITRVLMKSRGYTWVSMSDVEQTLPDSSWENGHVP